MSVVDENADTIESEVVSGINSVPILVVRENAQRLDMEILKQILGNYQDHPVAIISVFGKHRSGKSFLLNFLCQYMMEKQSPDWFKRERSKLVNVFHWKSGIDADTSGIHITNKPFIVRNDNGQDVAVFLMDTQGNFDKEMTLTDGSVIFSLSTLLSSVQIYNIDGQIGEDDLQNLGNFYDHAHRSVEGTAEFQCLMFLNRNWQIADFRHGSEGGMEYLGRFMEAEKAENKAVRKKIKESFADVRCHLLPRPGENVTQLKDSDHSEIKLSDINKGFLKAVDDLAKCLFSKHKLVVKQLKGKPCTGKVLMRLATMFDEKLESGVIPKVNTILEMNKKEELFQKIEQAETEYKNSMNGKIKGEYIEPETLDTYHDECLAKVLQPFCEQDVLDEETSLFYQKMIEQLLTEAYPILKHENNARAPYDDTIQGRLEQFYELLSADYLHTMNKAARNADDFFLDKIHKRFKKTVIKNLQNVGQGKAIEICKEILERLRLKVNKGKSIWKELLGQTQEPGPLAGMAIAIKSGNKAATAFGILGVILNVGLVVGEQVMAYGGAKMSDLRSIRFLNSDQFMQPIVEC